MRITSGIESSNKLIKWVTVLCVTAALSLACVLAVAAPPAHAQGNPPPQSQTDKPLLIKQQGSFAVGGTVEQMPGEFDPTAFIAPPDGQTLHGDHAYVQFQIPPNARGLPLV